MSSNVPPAGPRKRQADPRLDSLTHTALVGAEQLNDTDLADALQDAIDRLIIRHGLGRNTPARDEFSQDLRELAAVALATARRLDRR